MKEKIAEYAREIIRAEATTLTSLADRVDQSFVKAVRLILLCCPRIPELAASSH